MTATKRSSLPLAPWGAAAMLVLALIAFWPSYLSRLDEPIDTYTHAHALAMTAWLLLLVTQPLLIAGGHRGLHRALGRWSIVVAASLVAAGLLLAHQRLRTVPDARFDAQALVLYLALGALVLFVVPYVLGLVFRRQRAVHGRLMLSTLVAGLDPIFARLVYFAMPSLPEQAQVLVTYGVIDAILLSVIWGDWSERGARWVFPLMLVLTITQQVGYLKFAPTSQFRAFAVWYERLPFT